MNRQLSTYLDILRVAAAFIVFLSHLSWTKLSGGFLWQTQPFGHDGVIVFFVLSGFVIQYVATEKENNFRDYSIARLARLYSVVVPALFLTLICDTIGQSLYPAIYPVENTSAPIGRMLAAALFLTQSWGWNLALLSNNAFWSLPYEFWYYLIFGAAFFLQGWQRIAWVAAGALLAGPAILVYFPLWLFGATAFRAIKRKPLSKLVANILFFSSATIIALILWQEGLGLIERKVTPYFPPSFSPIDFLIAVALALNLYAAAFIDLPLRRIGRPVAYLASFTFALYLFHLPLLHLAATIFPRNWPIGLRGLAIGTSTLALVFVLGLVSEHRKKHWASMITQIFKLTSSKFRSV